MNIELKYVPTLNAYTSANHRHLIQVINRELYRGDFWQFGSGYIPAHDIDRFMKLALTEYTVTVLN